MSKKRANKSKRRPSNAPSQAQSRTRSDVAPKLQLVTDSGARPSGRPDSAQESKAQVRAVPRERQTLPSVGIKVVEKAAAAPVSVIPDPPVSVEDFEEETLFFEKGHLRTETPHAFAASDGEDDHEHEVRKPSPKMTPAARARRAHFSKYVKGAMVTATAILLLAGVRWTAGRMGHGQEQSASAAVSEPTVVEVRRAEAPAPMPTTPSTTSVATTGGQVVPTVAAAPASAPPAEPAKPAAAAPVETPPAPASVAAAESAAAPAAATPAPVAKPSEVTPAAATAGEAADDGKTAAQNKNEARKFLERGKAAAAIESGERSVALDPTDGDAWLILGAAYQEKGNVKDARRAFQSCSKQAKRGPISECRAMLQ